MDRLWRCARWNLRSVLKSPQCILGVIMSGLLCFLLTEFTIDLAWTYQTSLQALEPYIWCFADSSSICYASIALMLVLANLPRLDTAESYLLFRVNRFIWLGGQLLTTLIITLGYCTFLLLVTILLCGRQANFLNQWSDTEVLLSFSNDKFQTAVNVARKAVKLTLPYESALHIFFLFFQYILLASALQLFLTLRFNKKAATLGTLCFHAYGYLLSPDHFMVWFSLDNSQKYLANLLAAWLSPLQHAAYIMHNFGYDKLPKLWVSQVLLGVCTFFLCLGTYRSIRNYRFEFIGGR